jgi:beta-glucuronidase
MKELILIFLTAALVGEWNASLAQSSMINIYGRKAVSLNGEWKVIVDPSGTGDWRQVWTEKKPKTKTDFVEYSFEGGPVFHVPGDFNTQMTELFYVEGVVWYKKTFHYNKKNNERVFINFGAVNYLADVYLNGKLLGSHEGGFTSFQFELTNDVQQGENTIIVKANSQRRKDGLPGLGYDWFNYGGITRDVHLIRTSNTYIEDYFIQLKKHSSNEILGWVKLNGSKTDQNIQIQIPELKINYKTRSNKEGVAEVKFPLKAQLWSSENPKLYNVLIQAETDTVADDIGFRSVEVKGTTVLLNGKPVFFRGVNIHEERPIKGGKAYAEADATVLLG